MAAETAAFALVFDWVKNLVSARITQKREFFHDHVEPIQLKLVDIHKDYIAGFQEIRKHLKDGSVPSVELMDFMKERRRVYDHDRVMSRNLTAELNNATVALDQDLLEALRSYSEAILQYFAASAPMGGYSWYTDFISVVDSSVRAGYQDYVWPRSGFSNNPRGDLIGMIDQILDLRLPYAFERTSVCYAVLKRQLL